MATFEQLVGDYLEGALDVHGKAELADLLEADEEKRELFVDLYRNERLLVAKLGTAAADEFADGILSELHEDENHMIDSVMADVRRYPRMPRRATSRELRGPASTYQRRPEAGYPARVGVAGWGAKRWLAAAAVLLVAVGASLLVPLSRLATGVTPIAQLATTGGVTVHRGSETLAGKDGMSLAPGDSVAVAETGDAQIWYPDGTRLDIDHNSRITLRANRRPAERGGRVWAWLARRTRGRTDAGRPYVKHVDVVRGALLAQVVRQPADRRMSFSSPQAEALVLGTRFTMGVLNAETRIQVIRGKVLVSSKATGESYTLSDGYRAVVGERMVVSARPRIGRDRSGRATRGLQALYTFTESAGPVVHDLAKTGAPLDLYIKNVNAVVWLPDGGLRLRDPTILMSRGPATRLYDAFQKSNALSVEAWVRPRPAEQGGPARIVTFSRHQLFCNFLLGMDTLGQTGPVYMARLLSTEWNRPERCRGVGAGGRVRPVRTHLVFTRDATGQVRLYVDGADRLAGIVQYAGGNTLIPGRPAIGGTLENWDRELRLSLGDQPDGGARPWLGDFFLVAFYDRALAPEEVRGNFQAGVSVSSKL